MVLFMTIYQPSKLAEKSSELRRFKSKDIVKRLGIISPDQVHISGYSVEHPRSIFNASAVIEDNQYITLYARIIVGYFMYISAIVKIDIPINDVLSGSISYTHYPARIVITPGVRQDIWGAEDPRAFKLDGDTYILYTGRTVWYFNIRRIRERTLPILAFKEGDRGFRKGCAFTHPKEFRERVISDKDAVIIKVSDGSTYLLHRPHIVLEGSKKSMILKELDGEGSQALALASKLNSELARCKEGKVRTYELSEITLQKPVELLRRAKFESKIGWGTPPIEVGRDKYVLLVHGVDKYIEAYRAFAVMIEYRKDEGLVPTAVTRTYIFEPKEPYEIFGDRPYVVFPCGLLRLNSDEALIVYGAADQVVGFGLASISELLNQLDKGRLE